MPTSPRSTNVSITIHVDFEPNVDHKIDVTARLVTRDQTAAEVNDDVGAVDLQPSGTDPASPTVTHAGVSDGVLVELDDTLAIADAEAEDDAAFVAKARKTLAARRRNSATAVASTDDTAATDDATHALGVDATVQDANSVVSDPRFQNRARLLSRSTQHRFSIVGGDPVQSSDLMDCVALSGGGTYGASGVLITPRIVLTAGHSYPYSDRVFFGERTAAGGQVVDVIQRQVHPRYKVRAGERNDLLLLLLERAPHVVQPRRLAPPAVINSARFGRIAGFGATNLGGTGGFGVKREVMVPIVSHRCDEQVDGQPDSRRYGCERGRELVAGQPNLGLDTCVGDSGGPLYVQDPNGDWLLAAITSRWTDRGLRRCGDGAIYVRVDVYRKWIAEVVAAWQ